MSKSQVTLISSVVLILMAVLVISLFIFDFYSFFDKPSEYVEIKSDSDHIGAVLASAGYPPQWDSTTVKKVGLLDGERITLNSLKEFSEIDYETSKYLLGVKYDYMFVIERNGKQIHFDVPINRDFFGWNGRLKTISGNGGSPFTFFFNFVNARAKNIAKSERFVTIEGQGIGEAKMIIYTWDTSDLTIPETECNDGVDNDEDGFIDLADLGCENLLDIYEINHEYNLMCRFTIATSTECHDNETAILQFSSGWFGGVHAALPNQDYSNKLCCFYKNYIEVKTGLECDMQPSDAIYLTQPKNAHIAINNDLNYQNKICLIAKSIGNPIKHLDCKFESNCGDTRECIFSIDADNNAHIGGCNNDDSLLDYTTKYCCEFVDG